MSIIDSSTFIFIIFNEFEEYYLDLVAGIIINEL